MLSRPEICSVHKKTKKMLVTSDFYCFVSQSTLPNFKQNEFSVVRQHEEFIWLHDSFVENEEYAGYIVSTEPHQIYSVVESQMAPYKVVHYIGNRVPFWDVLAFRIST